MKKEKKGDRKKRSLWKKSEGAERETKKSDAPREEWESS